jgi:hypothetical protein
MSKIKVFTIVMLIAMLAALPVGQAMAATNSTTIGSGTIVNITMVTNGGITTVMLDLMDGNGLVQTVSVSLETAISLGLVITNAASIATVATLTDVVDPTLTTTGTINALDFDDPLVPTLVIVNLTLTPVDVVIDALTAQNYVPSFVLVDPVTFFMTAVDPSDFTDPVTLTDMNTLVATTGTVTSITVDDLASATSTVTVNLTPDPTPVDVSISLEDAVSNGLLIVNTTMIGQMIVIDPTLIVDSTTYSNVVSRLGAFFGSTLGIDFATLEAYHEAGFGYGVITQSLWMATNLGGDAAMLEAILQAKLSGDYSALETTATNWGQFRKEAISSAKQNQGQVMSGKADLPTEETTSATATTKTNNGNGNSNEKSNNGKANADTSNKNKP